VSSAHWFISINGEAKGPLTEDKIRELLADNLIDEHSSVWSSESASDAWQPLFRSELRHLMAGKAVRPPPLPGQQASSFAAPLDGPKTVDTLVSAPPSRSSNLVSHADSLGADRTGRDTTSSPRGSATGFPQTRGLAQFLLMLGLGSQFLITSFFLFTSMMVDQAIEKDGTAFGLRISERLDGVVSIWLMFFSATFFAAAFTWWLASETAALVEEEHLDGRAPASFLPPWTVWLTFLPVVGTFIAIPFLHRVVSGRVSERRNRADGSFVIWTITATLASLDGLGILVFGFLGAEHPYYCLGTVDERNLEYCNGVDGINDMLLWFSFVALFWVVLSVRRGIGYDPFFGWLFSKRH
jgi:hypothetical protein